MKIIYVVNDPTILKGDIIVTLNKARALAAIPNNKVYIISADAHNEFDYNAYKDVNFINLNIGYPDIDTSYAITDLIKIFINQKKYKEKLVNALKYINPDIVVSISNYEKYFLPNICKNKYICIREFHLQCNFRKLAAKNVKEKIVSKILDYYDYSFPREKYDHIVLLTNEDLNENWVYSKRNNISVIPNPVRFQSELEISYDRQVAISVGRLNHQKGFDMLIKVWALVVKQRQDWKLEIWGSGELKDRLEEQICSLGLEESVLLKGSSLEICDKLKNASIFVSTSRYEGLPLVLLEAMEIGLPPICFDYSNGPKDIINNPSNNGIIVENKNIEKMADKLIFLLNSPTERERIGRAAKMRAKDFHLDKVIDQWMILFNELINNKKYVQRTR